MTARNKISENSNIIIRLAESIIDEQKSPTDDIHVAEEFISLIHHHCLRMQSIIDEELS